MSLVNDREEIFAGINVTPLVDVVLVLLVIFMLTAPVIYRSTIKVQLPKAQTGESSGSAKTMQFTIQKDGSLYWDQKKTPFDRLESELQKSKWSDSQTVSISADREAQHGQVVRLMDILQKVGLNRFSLSVEKTR